MPSGHAPPGHAHACFSHHEKGHVASRWQCRGPHSGLLPFSQGSYFAAFFFCYHVRAPGSQTRMLFSVSFRDMRNAHRITYCHTQHTSWLLRALPVTGASRTFWSVFYPHASVRLGSGVHGRGRLKPLPTTFSTWRLGCSCTSPLTPLPHSV